MGELEPAGSLIGMGRLRQTDDRNNRFLLPRQRVPAGVRRRLWNDPEVTDQGATPQCVGYAGYGWLRAGPVTNKPPFTPTQLYKWAQERDEWPGENYDGSSTLGLMKALKDKGYINEYRWALDAETVVAWLLTSGPVVVGTWWYMDMFMPHVKTGFIEPTGARAGGHEWRVVGADLDKLCPDGDRGTVRLVNTWGRGWGQNGRATMSIRHLDQLIKDEGEAV